MRDYAKISGKIWQSRKFLSLKNDPLRDDCRLLYFHLHTNTFANMIGCYEFNEDYSLLDLGWDQIRYRKAMDRLSKAYLIALDDAENVVRIIDFLRHDPFTNPKHAAGAVTIASKLPNCEQKRHVLEDLQKMKHVSLPRIVAELESLSKGYRYPETETETETEPEPEPETESEPIQSQSEQQAAAEAASAEISTKQAATEAISEADKFFDDVLNAAGVRNGNLPQWWIPPASMTHVARWKTELGLTESEIIDTITASRKNHDTAATGPKAFDRAMKYLAGVKSADAMTPTNTSTRARNGGNSNFHDKYDHYLDQIRKGEIKRGPSRSDPFAS